MAQTSEKVKVNIHEKDFEVELFENQGKTFAKTHVNNFGEIMVPDFGGGREKALKNIEARIGNIMTAMQLDNERENRRKQWEEEQAKKQQTQN
jgi:protein subunit release factor A